MVFEPQVLMFPQLEHLNRTIQETIRSNPEESIAVYLNQEVYSILKAYYTTHSYEE